MTFKYQDREYSFPVSLNEITLGKRIQFHQEHGKILDEMAANIEKITDAFEKETEVSLWHLENSIRTFSFYTGIPLDEVRSQINLSDLLMIYNIDMQLLFEQERDIQLQPSYEWNGETWVIAAPDLKADSDMRFGEFIVAKEIVRQLHAVGQGKWEALPYLCAIYLRKEDEPFAEALVSEGSERLKMMQELPLDIALAVAFFLSGTLNIYLTTSHSSARESLKESIPAVILNAGDG